MPHKSRHSARQQVYIISRASGGIKIGISIRPRSRQSDLQMSTPDKLTIVKTYKPTNGTAADVEATFKRLLASRRLRGEWFSCEPDFAEVVVEAILENDTDKFDFVTKYLVTLQEWDKAEEAKRRSSVKRDNGEYREWYALLEKLRTEHQALLDRVFGPSL